MKYPKLRFAANRRTCIMIERLKNSKKILVLDDEIDIVQDLLEKFTRHGWKACGDSDGKSGLSLVGKFQPDVILTDINMPNMDGLVFLEKLKEQGLTTPVILMTGYRDTEKMSRAWAASAYDFLDKPCDLKMLLQLADNAYEYGHEYVRAARKRFERYGRKKSA